MLVNSQYDYVPYVQLPYGIPCSAKGLQCVFCRIRPDHRWGEFSIFYLGEAHGTIGHLSELVDMDTLAEPQFFELPVD
jgi:hypothetical protein